MDLSFELLSSMSPKFNKHRQPIRKLPTVLALKKSFRKSLVGNNANNSSNDVSLIIIESNSDTNSESSVEKPSQQSVIVVSDKESFRMETPVKEVRKNSDVRLVLSQEKYTDIKLWVDEVNKIDQEESMFSTVSTVLGNNSCCNGVANSTMLDTASKKFDELFREGKKSKKDGCCNVPKTPKLNSKTKNQLVIDDSLLTDDDTPEKQKVIDDMFQLNLNESLNTRVSKKKQIEAQGGLNLGSNKKVSVKGNMENPDGLKTAGIKKGSFKNMDSLLTDDDTPEKQKVIDDSFELNFNESLHTRISKNTKVKIQSCLNTGGKTVNGKGNTQIEDGLNTKGNKKGSVKIIDSLSTDYNSGDQKVIGDSFELNFNENSNSKVRKKSKAKVQSGLNTRCNKKGDVKVQGDDNLDNEDFVEYEALLDSLYGNSWREKKEEVLPSSEPRLKRTDKKTDKKIPKTEKMNKKVSSFVNNQQNEMLKTLQKVRFKQQLESPWAKFLKNICDPDTESDTEQEKKLEPIRLNFEDNDDDEKDKISWTTESSNSEEYLPKININKKINKNKSIKNYSFLASLSASVPVSKCDMSALIFRNNFKSNRDALTEKLFKLYNEKVFDDAIPSETSLEWSQKMRRSAGYCYCRKITRRTGAIERAARIVLSEKVVDSAERLRDTLIHEMCHAATWIVNQISDGHGDFWKAWASRAMQVFPELPPIKRCHQYVINTKYTYKCMNCGYCIGRHTKSLNTETKRCGHCFGRFEVLINKTSKKGETKSVPVTPKKPSGFALFVKENYANCKSPHLKHGDVMKILGQKFSSLKVDES